MTDPKITVLTDDRPGPGLIAEHGLAMWIEAGEQRLLFDAGQTDATFTNAERLGIELGTVESVVISHGHYDHTGSLKSVLTVAPHARLYLHPSALEPRYSIRDGRAKSIAMPDEAKAAALKLPLQQINWLFRPCSHSASMGITGPIPRETDFEDTGGPFFLNREATRPDPLEDDMALWIRTAKGLVICLGCCHAGLVNTVKYVQRISGLQKVRAIIGGMHLLNASEIRLARTCYHLEQWDVETLMPCHCTGERAIEYLAGELGDRVVPGHVGSRWPPDLSMGNR